MSGAGSSARGWVVTLAGAGINLVLGVLYAWSVVAKALVSPGAGKTAWTRTEAAIPFAVATAVFAVTMIFAGRVQDKVGPRLVATLGGLMLGLGMVASAFVDSPWMMALTFGVMGGAGIGLGYSATTPSAIKWFPPARKGLITGLVVSGVGLAPVYMSPLASWMLGTLGIGQTFVVLGVGTIVVVGGLAQLLGNPPAGYVAAGAVGSGGGTGVKRKEIRREVDWQGVLRTPQFYGLWVMFILAAQAGLLLIANAADIAKQGLLTAFVAVIILSVFNTSGRVVGGWVSDRIGRRATLVLAMALQAGNLFAFQYYTSAPLLCFGFAFAGLCYGTLFTLMPAATADFYGVRNLGVNYGLVFTAFGVAGALGALLGGRVRDVLGSYNVAFMVSGGLVLGAALLACFVKPPRVVERGEVDFAGKREGVGVGEEMVK